MDKSKYKTFLVCKGIKSLLKWIRRSLFIVMAALMIGFTNAFYDECRMVNDTKNYEEQEQLIDDDDINEWGRAGLGEFHPWATQNLSPTEGRENRIPSRSLKEYFLLPWIVSSGRWPSDFGQQQCWLQPVPQLWERLCDGLFASHLYLYTTPDRLHLWMAVSAV